MSQMLKCPNPSCPYVFDPSQVPVGVVLSCPRCGMQFTLGTPPNAPGAPANPTNPAGAPQGARGPGPSNPEFEAVGQTALEERDPNELLPARGTNKAQVFILAGIAAVLMAGTILALVFIFLRRSDDAGSVDNVTKLVDFNISVDSPPSGWTRDDNMRVTLGSPFVMSYRHENPEAYMAFGATEPEKGRSPRPSEMRRDMMSPLQKLFDPSSMKPGEPAAANWLGVPIVPADPFPNGFSFRAQSNDGLNWFGETYVVAHKGIAYHWLSWCSENNYEGMKENFATFRAKFKLLDLRKDWKELRSSIIDFKGDTIPYTISDAEALWKEVPPADLTELKKVEPDLDKRLRIHLTPRRDRKARAEEAELSVYLLNAPSDDATETARKFAQEMESNRIKQANSDFAPPTFKELTDADVPEGDPSPDSAPKNTKAVRLLSKVNEAPSANRLIVVSGIKSGDKTVVVLCWTEATKRDPFETKFIQIASSLR